MTRLILARSAFGDVVPKILLPERINFCQSAGMFLRRHRKEAGEEDYQYWSLVKTVRTARGPRHQIVVRLGKLDGAEVQAARGWEDLDALLEGSTPIRQLPLTPAPALRFCGRLQPA